MNAFVFEIMAQYYNTGKITLDRNPLTVAEKHDIDLLEKDMHTYLATLTTSIIGKVAIVYFGY